MSDSVKLKVRVNPRSSVNRVTGWQGGTLSVKLTAPPVEGAANKACIEFLAKVLGVKKSQLVLLSGTTSREKIFQVDGLSHEELRRRINSAC
ncbi:MAG: DUF167 domain-containing protein [Armatimonadota bacterium]